MHTLLKSSFFIFTEPPHVSLSEEKLILKTPQTLKCYSSKYYPLDAQVSTNLLWQIIDFDNIYIFCIIIFLS